MSVSTVTYECRGCYQTCDFSIEQIQFVPREGVSSNRLICEHCGNSVFSKPSQKAHSLEIDREGEHNSRTN